MSNLRKAVWTNSISKTFGKIASYEFPKGIQKLVNTLYVKVTGLSLDEFKSIENYKTLNELFTRELVKKREFSGDEKDIIAPSDSLITEAGDLKDDLLFQIKDFAYGLENLLTKNISYENIEKVKNGKYINFYLSPKDYHRYHVPLDMKVTKAVHVPGALYPVNFSSLNRVSELFVKNERVILECFDSNDKLFYIVLVGALNVGKMTLSFDERVETNNDALNTRIYEYENINLKKGDELGMFKMGSTVVMIFEKDFVGLKVEVDKKVRFTDLVAIKQGE